MRFGELAAKIETLQPEASPREVARLCLLLATQVDNMAELADEARLNVVWQSVVLRLQAATDQHAAMTGELERLSQVDPASFTIEQVWVLIRAIRVQAQLLGLYVGKADDVGWVKPS